MLSNSLKGLLLGDESKSKIGTLGGVPISILCTMSTLDSLNSSSINILADCYEDPVLNDSELSAYVD